MKNWHITTTIFVFVILFFSCQGDTIKPDDRLSDYFPNSVGDSWEYDVFDSSSVRAHPEFPAEYTVTVSVVGKKTLLDNSIASIWQYQYPWGLETCYVKIDKDTVKIYDPFRIETVKGIEFPLSMFIIPFSDSQRWSGKLLLIDSFHVYPAPTVTGYSETFTDCYNIFHYYVAPNTEYRDNYWFKPNLGMVRIHYDDYNFSPRNKYLWRLKNYSVH